MSKGWIDENIEPDIANYLFNIRVTLPLKNESTFQRNVIPDLKIDFDMLEEQLTQTPEMIAFWNMILAEQKARVEAIERRIKTVRGQVWESIIKDSRDRDVDIRSTDIKEIINTDQSIMNLEIESIRERKKEDKIKAVADALVKKFDALRSLSGFKREERRSS